ncbi:MAG: hypothetical protein HY822_05935 [Acidobacteria bacterium]|nr:hypothetical protein [Acidobacteriota bacterium]
MKRLFAILVFCLLWLSAGAARRPPGDCGTHGEISRERLFLPRRAQQARRAMPGTAALESALRAAGRDIGQIAILDDSDGVVGRLNPFNLDNRTIVFSPSAPQAARYRFRTQEAEFDAAAAAEGARLTLDDDDFKPVALPFAFPFFGAVYRGLFVNSDGNLTFGAGDNATSERSLGRLTAGAPRIAALFRDLDPTQSADGVRVFAEASRVVVSWVRVPEFRDFGAGPQQTFQIRLFPDGRIELAYQGAPARDAVVGISPGRLQGSSSVVSFSEGSGEEYSSTLAERFASSVELDVVTAAQKFYQTHEDAYDYLVFFNNLGIDAGDSAVAYELTLRTSRQGIGDRAVDSGSEYGSPARLQSAINMGPLSQYPPDPYALVPRRAFAGDTPMSVLAHEAGHLFLAYASVRDPNSFRAKPMLCSDGAHWSFAFNADASLVSGNRIRDNGAGTTPRFTTVAAVEAYSALDRYLMGLLPPEQVPSSFYVQGAPSASSCLPRPGVSFDGERRDVAIEEIVAAEGRRAPDHTVSQRRYRFAFVLVIAKGSEPAVAQLAQLERYREEFEVYFRRATGDLAAAETGFARQLRLSVFPAAGVLENASATAEVSIAAGLAEPLTVALSTARGLAGVPASVTIPAGATKAAFTVRGLRAGVEELSAEAASPGYESAAAFLQVTASAAELKLTVAAGDRQPALPGAPLPEPVLIRIADRNNLPYPGLTIRAVVSGGGSVTPVSAVSDENGVARFVWTPGPGAPNELTASLEGGTASVKAIALGKPAVAAGAVVNAASFAAGLAPGSLATVFGANLAGGAAEQASRLPLPTQLAGVRVLIEGQAVPLLFASDRQINFLAPATLPAGETALIVSTPLGASSVVRVPVASHLPGLFFDPASRQGAVIVRGEYWEVYGTGLGAVRPSPVLGLEETLATPRVLVDGQPVEVLFSGLAPGFPGLYQVNVRVPSTLPAGSHRLRLEIGGAASNEVLVIR